MARRKTQNEINSILAAKNITMLGAYKNWKTPVQVKCNLDGYVWSTRLQDLANGHGCHQCKGVPRISESEVDDYVAKKQIERVSPFLGKKKKTTWKCLKDAYVWDSTFSDMLIQNQGCPKCAKNAPLSKEGINADLLTKNIELVDYAGRTQAKSLFRCLSCEFRWATTVSCVRHETGCPRCAKRGFDSSLPCVVYFGALELNNRIYYKVGISSKDALGRLKDCHRAFDLMHTEEYANGLVAREREVHLHSKYAFYRDAALRKELKSGFTEIFTENIFILEYA